MLRVDAGDGKATMCSEYSTVISDSCFLLENNFWGSAKHLTCKNSYPTLLIKASIDFNAFHVAGECRRQVKKLTKFGKKCQNYGILWLAYIWNHHEECIQISTNMSSIGLVIPEITCDILKIWENKHSFSQ